MRNIIWTALTKAKYDEIFCCALISRFRNITKWYNALIIVFSATGVLNWKVFQSYPQIVCGIVASVTLIKSLESQFFPSEKTICKLEKIIDFYSSMFLDIQKIWADLEVKNISDEVALSKLHLLQQKEIEISKSVNEVVKLKYKKLAAEAKINSDNYFKQAYNT